MALFALLGCGPGAEGPTSDLGDLEALAAGQGSVEHGLAAGPWRTGISASVLGATATVSTSSRMAGAIDSFIFRGVQYINAADHGRELQSASSFDKLGECYNPTEAGNRDDGAASTTTSDLLSLSTSGNVLQTKTNMAFWLRPGTAYGRPCGTTSTTQAVNTRLVAGHLLSKRVAFGFEEIPNVLDYRVTFYVPERHVTGTFEALTGYMPAGFSSFFTWNPATRALAPLSDGPGEQSLPVVLSTPDGQHAMGVYSPELPQGNTSYGRFRFVADAVTKWNCVFRETGVVPGPHPFRCFVAFGTLNEVQAALTALDAKFSRGRVLGQVASVTLDPGGTTATLKGWACARGVEGAIAVQVLAGGPRGFGIPVTTVTANGAAGAEVATRCGTTGSAHAFSVVLGRAQLTALHGNALFVYGVTPPATPQRHIDVQLLGSGQRIVPCPAGTTCTTPAPLPMGTLDRGPMSILYRVYNGRDHLITATQTEGAALGYQLEGRAFSVYQRASPLVTGLYRCFSQADHFVSTAPDCEGGGRLEGLYGFIATGPLASHSPVVRFFNPSTGDHHSTIHPEEGRTTQLREEGVQGWTLP